MLIGPRRLITDALHERDVASFPPAASVPGATALGSTGQLYTAQRWPTPDDAYRWVSSGESLVVIQEPVQRVIGPGEDFTTVEDALIWASGLYTALNAQSLRLINLHLADNFDWNTQPRPQIVAEGLDLSSVYLTSEAPVVEIDREVLTVMRSGTTGHPLFSWRMGAKAPQIRGVLFRAVGNEPPPDPTVTGSYTPIVIGAALSGTLSIVSTGSDFAGNNLPAKRLGGFEGFGTNVLVSGADAFLDMSFGVLRDATDKNLRLQGSSGATLLFSNCDGAANIGLEADGLSRVSITAFGDDLGIGDRTGTYPDTDIFLGSYRNTPGVDSANDLVVRRGGSASVTNTGILGGICQPANVWTVDGAIFDARVTGSPTISGLIKPASYTTAALPLASANAGVQVYVTDGAAGLPVMAYSDGATWLRCDTRSAVSST